MRIIFEPTESENHQHKVVIESLGDDSDIKEVVELLRYALLGWGFAEKNVYDWLGDG